MRKIEALVFSESQDTWNKQLDSCLNANIYSTYEWGEYKKTSWAVERVVFQEKGKFVGQVQILFKMLGPWKFGWCSSGINLLDYEDLGAVIEALKQFYNFGRTYIRFNFCDAGKPEIKFAFDSCPDLLPVSKTVNSGYTIRFFDLLSVETAKYSKNNRYYLKKAMENNLSFSIGELDVAKFCQIHNAMVSAKSLQHLAVNEQDIQNLKNHFGAKLKLAEVKDGTATIAVALLIQHQRLLHYFLAGSGEEGRKKSASFLMIDSILKYITEQKIREFDFGGITPFKADASGVNRFKMGFGGDIVNYVGERNMCSSRLLTKLFDFIISRKVR